MWTSFNPNNGTVLGLDSLLIDDKVQHMLEAKQMIALLSHYSSPVSTL
jgi:hypothetical protein